MKRPLIRLSAVALLACAAATTVLAQTPIKIGFLATFSGPVGTLGRLRSNCGIL